MIRSRVDGIMTIGFLETWYSLFLEKYSELQVGPIYQDSFKSFRLLLFSLDIYRCQRNSFILSLGTIPHGIYIYTIGSNKGKKKLIIIIFN